MVAQERPPGLRRRPSMFDHVLGDRRLGDGEAKLQQFAMPTMKSGASRIYRWPDTRPFVVSRADKRSGRLQNSSGDIVNTTPGTLCTPDAGA
jgi:hypothetical protein